MCQLTYPITYRTRTEFTREDDEIIYKMLEAPNVDYAGRNIYKEIAKHVCGCNNTTSEDFLVQLTLSLQSQHPRHSWQSWRDRSVKHVVPVYKKIQAEKEAKRLKERIDSSNPRKIEQRSQINGGQHSQGNAEQNPLDVIREREQQEGDDSNRRTHNDHPTHMEETRVWEGLIWL